MAGKSGDDNTLSGKHKSLSWTQHDDVEVGLRGALNPESFLEDAPAAAFSATCSKRRRKAYTDADMLDDAFGVQPGQCSQVHQHHTTSTRCSHSCLEELLDVKAEADVVLESTVQKCLC